MTAAKKSTKKSGGTSTKSDEGIEWGGFLNVRVNEMQKAEFHSWFNDRPDDVWEEFLLSLATGTKFSLTYNKDNDTFTASLTAVGETRNIEGWRCVLTAHAQDWLEVTALVTYKDALLLQRDWSPHLNQPMSQPLWG